MKTCAMLFVVLMMSAFSGCNTRVIDSTPTVQPISDVSITLTTNASTYELVKVPQGVVAFSATIRNQRPETITIAHPSRCFPADVKVGDTRHFKDSHGKSEILLEITKPNKRKVTLRDGWMHGFDPNNVYLLTIPPGGSESFSLGWFFLNARGKWENDREAATVFLDKGAYKARIIFRNVFPNASVYNAASNKHESIDVWVGEIQSEEVIIEII